MSKILKTKLIKKNLKPKIRTIDYISFVIQSKWHPQPFPQFSSFVEFCIQLKLRAQ